MRIAVLGAGAWGSALAISLCATHEVRLWSRDPARCEALARNRSSGYLAQALPPQVSVEPDLRATLAAAELVIVATSTSGLRPTLASVAVVTSQPALLWACKGFESASRRMPHQIVSEALPQAARVGVMSGPSFALEVAAGLPTALVIASREPGFAAAMVSALNTPRLRLYSSTDVVGVVLGGAVKNVIAIAAGIADGLELGRNARAALVTRGLAEIVRLGVALGGQAETFMGLAGVGDLVLTTTGDLSRNREVGIGLARGRALGEILAQLGHVAEGVHSALAARDLARERRVEMPITEAVCAVLFEGVAPAGAVHRLLTRDPRSE